ncbi:hypothetical protein BEP19_11285 [Ammoniphilus oxalaticus]|uniref:Pro-sigmaK processing inhibitor BofA n=1 Tax=Ammoniphilus oxalaticus TaxID=66863 RepID=A0A419SGA6_9BACL|nr:pro-sigmaK processing inhibitor BofA family protein [Ammoniphilus oxalaticus]RKD22821.1 hypothetical protein BEP19_11285 [Ammoniphilus oxalaticus]
MTTVLWGIIAIGLLFFVIVLSQMTWLKPIRWVAYGLFKLALGGVLLFLFNSVGAHYDFTIPINPITAAASGLLGLPGLIGLVVVKALVIV